MWGLVNQSTLHTSPLFIPYYTDFLKPPSGIAYQCVYGLQIDLSRLHCRPKSTVLLRRCGLQIDLSRLPYVRNSEIFHYFCGLQIDLSWLHSKRYAVLYGYSCGLQIDLIRLHLKSTGISTS
jgi:hypothetical protein